MIRGISYGEFAFLFPFLLLLVVSFIILIFFLFIIFFFEKKQTDTLNEKILIFT